MRTLPRTPTPTSAGHAANHRNVFSDARIPIKTYRYYDPKAIGLDFAGMLADLQAAPTGSIILLHVCAHNPTGVDPTREQWLQIANVVKVCVGRRGRGGGGSRGCAARWATSNGSPQMRHTPIPVDTTRRPRASPSCRHAPPPPKTRKLFPFFDSAYQGFATGDLEGDAFSLRSFEAAGIEFLVAQSFAKNMGLYGERTGCLHVVTASATSVEPLRSQVCAWAHGALGVDAVAAD